MRRKKGSEFMDGPGSRPWYLRPAYLRAEQEQRIRQLLEDQRFRGQHKIETVPQHAPDILTYDLSTTDSAKDEDIQQTVTTAFDESSSSIISERLTHNPEWVTWLSTF